MKISKSIFSTLMVVSILVGSGCSNASVSQNISTEKPVQAVSSTELSDMSAEEVAEMKTLLANEKESDSSFSVKTALEGKDIDIDLFLYNPKASKRARFWFIKDANKLLYAGASPRKRWFLERKLGGLFPSEAFKVQVLFWVERADLLRIKEVSLDDSYLLAMSGITSAPHLARFNNIIDQAALKVQLSLLAFQYGLPIPSLSKIESWTSDATKLSPVIY